MAVAMAKLATKSSTFFDDMVSEILESNSKGMVVRGCLQKTRNLFVSRDRCVFQEVVGARATASSEECSKWPLLRPARGVIGIAVVSPR
jgi:hypothetical protein